MKQITVLLLLLAVSWRSASAAPAMTNSGASNRVLLIDSSSMPVAAGQATLIIGELRRTNGVYAGDYQIKVFPYFYKNENGRLAIVVTDEALAGAAKGKVAAITGTATTSGQGGHTRAIAATATPVDKNRGKLKLWFTAGDRKMVFEPAYHFAGEEKTAARTAMTPTNFSTAKSL
jgi:hypothetical protein